MVTLITQPQLFTPSENPVLFQFTTSESNTLYFNIQMVQASSGALIVNDKAYVTPINTSGSEYDISDVMRSLVKWDINTGTSSLWGSLTRPVNNFKLNISEYGLTGSRIEQIGATLSTDAYYTWDARLRRNDFSIYNYLDYVATEGNTSSNITFLTDKPNWTKVNGKSFEQLYFLKSPTYSVKYDFRFYKQNAQVGNESGTISSTYSMVNLSVAPRDLKLHYNYDYDSYSVKLITTDGLKTKSNTRFYKCVPLPPICNVETFNVIWVNKFGGIDSYQFVQPVETRKVERVTIQKNIYKYDSNLNYTDRQRNILNNSDEIIYTKPNSEYKVYTQPLNDDEAYWLSGLLESKQVFIEISTDKRTLYPCIVNESTYEIKKRLLTKTGFLQVQFTFKINGDALIDPVAPSSPSTDTFGRLSVMNDSLFAFGNSASITSIKFNGATVSGITFPVLTGTTQETTFNYSGVYTVEVRYDNSTPVTHFMQFTDSYGNLTCTHILGSSSSLTYTNSHIEPNSTVMISLGEGSCF